MQFQAEYKIGSKKFVDNDESTKLTKLFDLTLTDSLMQYGEVRLDNSNGFFTGDFKKGDEFTVDMGVDSAPARFFTGIVDDVFESSVVILKVEGNAGKLHSKTLKKSFNKISAAEVIKFILQGTGVKYSNGKLPSTKYHSYVIAGGTPIEELIRVNEFLNLGFETYFDKKGSLVLKTEKESINKTEIVFAANNFARLENGIFETFLVPEVAVFDQIKILDGDFVVRNHRIYYDGNKSRSIFAVEKA